MNILTEAIAQTQVRPDLTPIIFMGIVLFLAVIASGFAALLDNARKERLKREVGNMHAVNARYGVTLTEKDVLVLGSHEAQSDTAQFIWNVKPQTGPRKDNTIDLLINGNMVRNVSADITQDPWVLKSDNVELPRVQ